MMQSPRFHNTVLVLLLLCLSTKSVSGICIDDSLQIPRDSTIKIGRLSNGLTYYLKYNNWPENRACFYLAQRVGSLQEEDS